MNPLPYASLFTTLWLLFSALWGLKAVVIRWKRGYAKGRALADTNRRFKFFSYFAFAFQVAAIPFTFWSTAPLLLEAFRSMPVVIAGLTCAFLGLALYLWAFARLGRNYSPCFDAHLPHELITTGPYRFIRHPGWLSKLIVGLAGLLVSGSLWMLPILIWLIVEMRRTIFAEERYMAASLPSYASYQAQTWRLVPFVF